MILFGKRWILISLKAPKCKKTVLLVLRSPSWERRHPWRPTPEAAKDGGVPGGKNYA